jgi:2-iminobutanoate/2-iminopropanoate deaminase
MNRRVGILFAVLILIGDSSGRNALSHSVPFLERKAINLPDKPATLPFSDAILDGKTLYLAGRLGLDPQTGKVPPNIQAEVKNILDGDKAVLAKAGMSMNDVVYVQVYCSDLSLYDQFNAVYRAYFAQDFPARAFIGAGSLLRGAHFELQAIAVKK